MDTLIPVRNFPVRSNRTNAFGLVAAVMAVAALASTAVAGECPFGWRPGTGVPGVDGWVRVTTSWDPDGSGPQAELFIVGGRFETAGEAIAAQIAAWDGKAWQALGVGLGGGDYQLPDVYALTVYNGELIAGGGFMTAGGIKANRIARWNGAEWRSLGTGVMDGNYSTSSVNAMTIFNGELIAGGNFKSAGGVTANYIARWNGTAWQTLGSGIGGQFSRVDALAVYNDELIVGGQFTTAGGVQANYIARWNGTNWQSVGTGMGGPTGSDVNHLFVFKDELIAAGSFVSAGGVPAGRIAAWNGTSWRTLWAEAPTSDFPWWHDFAVYEGELFAAGRFTRGSGLNPMLIVRWSGEDWQLLDWGQFRGGVLLGVGVLALAVFGDELIAGGTFTGAGGTPLSNIARWNQKNWEPLGSGMNEPVHALATYEGEVIAASEFSGPGGGATNHVTRWNGTAWSGLSTGMGGDAPFVSAFTLYNDELIASGYFNTAGGVPANNIAGWNGTAWRALGTGSSWVGPLTVFDGDLIAGLSSWDGSAWHELPAFPTNGRVGSLAVFDGKLIAGKASGANYFTHVFQLTGDTWTEIGEFSGPGDDYMVTVLGTFGGELIAGCDAPNLQGQPVGYIGRWNGTDWMAMGAGLNGPAYSLIAYDGELIVGGDFTTAGGEPANRIARWDGTNWQALGAGMNGRTSALTVYNGELIAAGVFTTAGGSVSAYWARWGPACARGDLNCDDVIDEIDAMQLVHALLHTPTLSVCEAYTANVNGDVHFDGTPKIDGEDISAFVRRLLADRKG